MAERLSDHDQHDGQARARLNRQWHQAWRDEHPDRAEWLDAHPPPKSAICDVCSAIKPNIRVYDWRRLTKGEDPVIGFRCQDCRRSHGRPQPREDPLTTFSPEAKQRIKAAALPTDQNPDYYIEGNTAHPVTETDREFIERAKHPLADAKDEPEQRRSKLAWFFEEDTYGLRSDDSG